MKTVSDAFKSTALASHTAASRLVGTLGLRALQLGVINDPPAFGDDLFNSRVLQLLSGFGFGRSAHLNVVDHLCGSGTFRHSGGGAFVLHHIRRAFPGNDAILNLKFEAVLSDFRFCQFSGNGLLDLAISLGACV